MVRAMPPVRNLAPGYTVVHPNRDKAVCKATKSTVVLILLISAALMLIITFGGWSSLQGMKPVNFAWALVYIILAFYISRWARGLLPIAAALGILLLVISLVAALGVDGTSWFDRSNAGFAHAQSIFGGGGLSANMIGLLTVILAPVQVLLMVFAMRGFSQGWNVEQEVTVEEAARRGGSAGAAPPPEPAAA
jgi:signal transduction histidine kinase